MTEIVAGFDRNFNTTLRQLPNLFEQSMVRSMRTVFSGPPSFQGNNNFQSGSTVPNGSTTDGTSNFGASSSYSSTSSEVWADSRSSSTAPASYDTFQPPAYIPDFSNFSGNGPSLGAGPSNTHLGGSSEERFGALSMPAPSGLSNGVYPDYHMRSSGEGSSMDVYNSAETSSGSFSPHLSIDTEMDTELLGIYTTGGCASFFFNSRRMECLPH